MRSSTRTFPFSFWPAILLALLVMILVAAVALADDSTPPVDNLHLPEGNTIQFDGQVMTRPAGAVGLWQIDGRSVLATAATRFVPNADAIQVGDWVRVVARNRGGQLVAQLIAKTRPIPLPTVAGPIVAMSPTQWTIGRTVVLIDANTQITGDPPDVGDWAVAQVRRTPAGLLAVRIHVRDAGPIVPPPERVIRGRIDAIGETSWIIGGVMVLIDAETRIEGDHPDVGDWAIAWVVGAPQGLLARRILVHDVRPDVIVFRGQVLAIQDGIWTVLVGNQEKTVLTDDNTRVIGEPGVGDWVGVKGVLTSDGAVLAHVIVKLAGAFPRVNFAGFVTAILPSADPAVLVWEVTAPATGIQPARTWTVLITEGTRSNVDPRQVTVGTWVKGSGDQLDDGLIQARIVRVTAPPRLPFRGEVTTRPDPGAPDFPQGLWIIGGTTVYVTAQTRIEGPVPEPGQQAGGFGLLRPDGALEALLLRALSR